MAFQESGACSSVPYKCLHIISSELYNSLVDKTECFDGNSNANNASSNTSANFQNNFYPQNNLLSSRYNGGHDRFDPDDDDYDPGSGRHPQLVEATPTHIPTTATPTRPPVSQSDTISPQHTANNDGDTSNNIEPTDDVHSSPSINASINPDDVENLNNIDTTSNNIKTQPHSYPSEFKDRIPKRKIENKKPYSGNRRKLPLSSMIIPKKDENINRKQEPMDTLDQPPLAATSQVPPPVLNLTPSHPLSSIKKLPPQVPPSTSNPLPPPTSIKKLPPQDLPSSSNPPLSSHPSTSHSSVTSFVPSKDGPKLSKTTRKIKDEVKWSPHKDHQEVKIKKPKKIKPEPKKRVFKFERNIPKIEDDEQMDVEHIPLNEDDGKMDISHDETPKKKSKPKIRVRTDIFDKPPNEVVKPKIRVRTDLFEENKSTKKNLKKVQLPISTKALREKNKKIIANNVRSFFDKNKEANNAKLKDLPIKVIKREKKQQIPKLKKSSSTNEENDADLVEIKHDNDVTMNELKTKAKSGGTKNSLVKKRAIKKEIIEKGKNTKLSHNIKREMIKAEMMNERDNAELKRKKSKVTKGTKRKNKFGTKPTGYIKFIKKDNNDEDEDAKGIKRKNKFGTKPTGYIKFIKKDKNDEDEDDSDKDDKNFKKKFSGSGFNMWKF